MVCTTAMLLLPLAATAISVRQANHTAVALHNGSAPPAAGVVHMVAANRSASTSGAYPTFQDFYNQHVSGRGIWKWNNALDAYQRHFSSLAGSPAAVAEVGVQSGGSMLMWKAVLGENVRLYGLDINPECKKFEEPSVTITLGDQADPVMWQTFFQQQAPMGLDILVDDGGHEAHQMLTTLWAPFPYIHAGGYIAIEDIHGAHYLHSFFTSAANFLGGQAQQGLVDSVHIYPFLMMVRKGGFAPNSPQATQGQLHFAGVETPVSDIPGMWAAINKDPQGGLVVLRNPAWGNFLTPAGLANFFTTFNELHAGAFLDTPTGCRTTTAAVCTNAIEPMTHTQQRITGVHIYADRAVIEVPTAPPRIEAVRKGTDWIGYGF